MTTHRTTTAAQASTISLVCRYRPRGHWISSNQAMARGLEFSNRHLYQIASKKGLDL